ncbi:MAG: hypothetical protein E6J79_21180, partial [Deltaproteobacteria bacterium]
MAGTWSTACPWRTTRSDSGRSPIRSARRRGGRWARGLACAIQLLFAAIAASCGARNPPVQGPGYVGSAACAPCHATEYAAWAPSLHALAAQSAKPGRVLAVFDGSLYWFTSLAARPETHDGNLAFLVPESGRGGAELLPISYVLGRGQIEQFLTPRPGGRLQALPLGYDTVAREWFDIFPRASPRDWAHWTNPGMTANSRCLECHTTAFEEG